MNSQHHRALRLCLVTHFKNQSFSQYRSFILKAIQGGVTSVQLREKIKNVSELKDLALQLKKLLRPFNVPLIINDHVDIAKEIDADGVHIGQSDLSPLEARKIMGPHKIIGWSVETFEELQRANALSCIDYIAASAVFPSKTKPDCKTHWGISGLKQLAGQSVHPAIGIGGIRSDNIRSVMEAGACGAAVIGAIHDAPNPIRASADLITEIDRYFDDKRKLCLKR